MRITRRTWLATTAASGLGICSETLPAQSTKPPLRTARVPDDGANKEPETEVAFTLLATAANSAEHAQAWGLRLQKLEVHFQTRQPLEGDKAQIKEQKLGRIRRVTVIAVLDRNGKILCHDRAFALSDSEKLGEWIRELKTYGAQGAPHGKPLFGLDESQFVAVLRALSPKQTAETSGFTLTAALGKIPLPSRHPLRLTPDAERWMQAIPADKVVRQNVDGLSIGTALAATLSEFGLAFRPLRTPGGAIELAVSPRGSDPDYWPIGWPLDANKPQGQQAPSLFKMVPVQLDDVPLSDVLTAAAQATETSIVIDYHPLDQQGIVLDELKVSVSQRKTTWGLLLRQVTFDHKLGRRIVADEANRVFVVITTLKESLKDNATTKSPKS